MSIAPDVSHPTNAQVEQDRSERIVSLIDMATEGLGSLDLHVASMDLRHFELAHYLPIAMLIARRVVDQQSHDQITLSEAVHIRVLLGYFRGIVTMGMSVIEAERAVGIRDDDMNLKPEWK